MKNNQTINKLYLFQQTTTQKISSIFFSLLLSLLLLSNFNFAIDSLNSLASSPSSQPPKTPIKISGVNFLQYQVNLTDLDNSANNSLALKRNYLNFASKINKNFSAKITFDITSSSLRETTFNVFLKFAYLKFKNPFWNFTLGLQKNNFYALSENLWGYRFIDRPLATKGIYTSLDNIVANGKVFSSDVGLKLGLSLLKDFIFNVQYLNGEGFLHQDNPNTRGVNGSVYYHYLAYHFFTAVEHKFNSLPTATDSTAFNLILSYQTTLLKLTLEGLYFLNSGYQERNDTLGFSTHARLNWNELLQLKTWQINTFIRFDLHQPLAEFRVSPLLSPPLITSAQDLYLGIVTSPLKSLDLALTYILKLKNDRSSDSIITFNSQFFF